MVTLLTHMFACFYSYILSLFIHLKEKKDFGKLKIFWMGML